MQDRQQWRLTFQKRSGDVDGDGFDEDDGVKPVVRKGPAQPTAEEVVTHRCTHIPCRSWCRACVMGQCPDAASRSIPPTGDQDEFCKIGMDYAFVTQGLNWLKTVDEATAAAEKGTPDGER